MMRALAAAMLVLVAATGEAEAADRVRTAEVTFRLVAYRTGASAGAAAIEARLTRGWKLYWRSPGAGGIPPQFDIAGSTNIHRFRVHWPAPSRFLVGAVGPVRLTTVGYEGSVAFPADFQIGAAGRPTALRLTIDYGVCSDVCVPGRVVLSRTLREAGPTPADAALVAQALDRVPRPATDQGFRITETRVAPDGRALALVVASTLPLESPAVFVETADGHRFGEPRMALGSDRRAATVNVPLDPLEERLLSAAMPVTVTIVDGRRAGETTVTPDR